MGEIIGTRLYSWDKSNPEIPAEDDRSMVEIIIKLIGDELSKTGDRVLIEEAENPGFESPHRYHKRMLSEVLPWARRIGKALVDKCGIKPGNTLILVSLQSYLIY